MSIVKRKIQGFGAVSGTDLPDYEFRGLSTDEPKPTEGFGGASTFLEIDTGIMYYWDAENGEWIVPGASNDGGGGDDDVQA